MPLKFKFGLNLSTEESKNEVQVQHTDSPTIPCPSFGVEQLCANMYDKSLINQHDIVQSINKCGGLHNVDYIIFTGDTVCLKTLAEAEV